MNNKSAGSLSASKTASASLATGAVAVVCCAGLPLTTGAPDSDALGRLLFGAGVLGVVAGIPLIVAQARHRRTCATPSTAPRGGDA